MSTGILLFSVLAAALVICVNLLQDGLKAPILVQTKLKPGMMVFLKGEGSDHFHVDFLTVDCQMALRVHFQPKHNITTLNTFDGQKWGREERFKRSPYQIRDPYLFHIQATKRYFTLGLRGSPRTGRLLANYTHRLPLEGITQVLFSGGRRNKLFAFAIVTNENQMKIFDDRTDTAEIRVIGKPASNFTIDLLTNDSVALRMSFHDSNIGCNSRIAGSGWGCETMDGSFTLGRNNKVWVHLLAKKTAYQITVNGKKFHFVYRVDPRLVTGVRVNGLEGHIVYSIRRREKAKYISCIACREWRMEAAGFLEEI